MESFNLIASVYIIPYKFDEELVDWFPSVSNKLLWRVLVLSKEIEDVDKIEWIYVKVYKFIPIVTAHSNRSTMIQYCSL